MLQLTAVVAVALAPAPRLVCSGSRRDVRTTVPRATQERQPWMAPPEAQAQVSLEIEEAEQKWERKLEVLNEKARFKAELDAGARPGATSDEHNESGALDLEMMVATAAARLEVAEAATMEAEAVLMDLEVRHAELKWKAEALDDERAKEASERNWLQRRLARRTHNSTHPALRYVAHKLHGAQADAQTAGEWYVLEKSKLEAARIAAGLIPADGRVEQALGAADAAAAGDAAEAAAETAAAAEAAATLERESDEAARRWKAQLEADAAEEDEHDEEEQILVREGAQAQVDATATAAAPTPSLAALITQLAACIEQIGTLAKRLLRRTACAIATVTGVVRAIVPRPPPSPARGMAKPRGLRCLASTTWSMAHAGAARGVGAATWLAAACQTGAQLV